MTTIEKLIYDSVNAARKNAESDRKKVAENRLAMYEDNFESLVEDRLKKMFIKETYDLVSANVDSSNNVFKRIINEISTVYKAGAVRKAVISDEQNDETYDALIGQFPIDIVLEKANQLTNVANECLIMVHPRNGRIEFDILTPDALTCMPMDGDPTRMASLTYPEMVLREFPDKYDIQYVYWDIYGNHLLFDSNGNELAIEDNPEGVNPYIDPDRKHADGSPMTVIPGAMFHRSYNDSSIFSPTEGNDLCEINIQTAVKLTYLNYMMKYMFRQLYMAGVDPAKMAGAEQGSGENAAKLSLSQVQDPAFPLLAQDANAKIGVLDYQINIKDIWEVIQNAIYTVASNYGLSASALNMTVDAQSGFALSIKKEGLEDARKKQVKHYRWYEAELFRIVRIVNNYHNQEKISNKAVFNIDFVEPSVVADDQEIRTQWQFDLKLGAKSVVDYMKFKNPDLQTDEKAIEAMRKNVELNRKASKAVGIDLESMFASFDEKQQTGGGAQA